MRNMRIQTILMTVAALLMVAPVQAGNFGSDLNLSLTPAAGGMGGVGYVRPMDPVTSVFGNPATLRQMEQATDFTLADSYLNVDVHTDRYGSVTDVLFSGDSDAEHHLLPNIAVRHRLFDKFSVGSGLQGISGLGSEFRQATALAPVQVGAGFTWAF